MTRVLRGRSIKTFARDVVGIAAPVSLISLLPLLSGCGRDRPPEEKAQAAQQRVLGTNLAVYAEAQNVTVTYSSMLGAATDWIALAPVGAPATTALRWSYTGGGTSGSLTFSGLDAGTYEARAFYDWIGTSSYTIQQTSPSFTVGASAVTLTPPVSVAAWAPITVAFSGFPGNQTDWITIAPAGSPASAYLRWTNTNGLTSGSFTFAGIPAGSYEVRGFFDWVGTSSMQIRGSRSFTVGAASTPSLALPARVNVGAPIAIGFSGLPGNTYDWISVSAPGAAAGTAATPTSWGYTNGQVAGTLTLPGIATAGIYEARVFFDWVGTNSVVVQASAQLVIDADADADGYGTLSGDCNDANPAINTGATDLCGNGVDEDCSGADRACDGTFAWSRQVGGTTQDVGVSVAADPSGNVLTAGYFSGSVTFSGSPTASAGSYDGFVVKHGSAGALAWARTFGGAGTDLARAVASDASGNVVVVGSFSGTTTVGGSPYVSAGGDDILVTKLDASGATTWTRRFGGTGNDSGRGVATDGAGYVYVTGSFRDTVDFGGGARVSAGGDDIVVLKLDAAGNHVWSQRYGGTDSDVGVAIAADAAGNTAIATYFATSVTFGGGALTTAGSTDIALAKLDTAGAHVASARFGSTAADTPRGVAFDATGNVVATGNYRGTVDFGGGALVSAGSDDIFLVKLSPTLTHVWSKRIGSTGSDGGRGVSIDAGNNVLLTASFRGAVDAGGGTRTSAGAADMLLAKFNSAGAHLFSKAIGGTADDAARGATSDAAGNTLVAGAFSGTSSFGGTALVASGKRDVFIAKYLP